MDSIEANHNNCLEDTSLCQLLHPASPDISEIYRDPELVPRIGDQYQVEIPPLMTESNRFHLRQSAAHAEGTADVDCSIPKGLSIPVMWVHDVVDHTKLKQMDFLGDTIYSNTGSVAFERNNGIRLCSKSSIERQYASGIPDHNATIPEDLMPKLEVLDDVSDNGKGLGCLEGHGYTMLGKKMDLVSSLPQHKKSELEGKHEFKDYCPVPGSLGGSWNEIEQESFLLGLYIFGKNLVQVKRFIESKGMGDILSYYYGQFYRSEAHRKWSDCQKLRSRRFIHGQRIFTGWRQHELLSRLLPQVSQECGSTLQEVTKELGEGKVPLEEYVSILKGMIGLDVLVEAIGIGKGKHDLTGNVMEPAKTNPVSSIRSEIPIGKACSSLTSADIIKFLTGDFRLSKARSNDLFWEAVWPRLLARGWHSEQPKNDGYVGSKHSLVFLIPGIKKFSKRKLVKGNHYFDSITDVLNKVASDPKLLELEVNEINGSTVKDEYGWDMDAKSDQIDKSNHQRPLYLRPRVPSCNSEVMKFTVVDTSLSHGEPHKIRELRTLPMDCAHMSTLTSPSNKSDSDKAEEQDDEPELANKKLLNDQGQSCTTVSDNKVGNNMNCMPSDLSSYVSALSKQRVLLDRSELADMVIDNHKDEKSIKCQFNSRKKSGRTDYLSPVLKRRRCKNTYSTTPHLKEELGCQQYLHEASPTVVAEAGPSQQKVPDSSSGKSSPDESSECILSQNCIGGSTVCEMISSHENPLPRALIDLNLPHVPPDFEMGEPLNVEASDSHDDSNTKEASFPLGTSQQAVDSQTVGTSNNMECEQPPAVNARRQSTRNRPLTTRVLEALECGFFSTKRRGRGTARAPSRRNSMSRSSQQRVHDHGGVSETLTTNSGNVGTDSMDSKAEGVDEECTSYMVDKSQIQSERKENHDFLGVP